MHTSSSGDSGFNNRDQEGPEDTPFYSDDTAVEDITDVPILEVPPVKKHRKDFIEKLENVEFNDFSKAGLLSEVI